jgi:adenylate cyclase
VIDKIQQNKIRILIIFGIFILYFLNGIGALDFSLRYGAGVDFNLRVLSSVISGIGNNITHPGSISLLLILIAGTALSVLLPVIKPWVASVAVLFSALPQVYISLAIPAPGMIMPMEYSLLILLILFSINALLAYFIETHSRQKLVGLFGQYIPPQIVDQISRNPEALDMTGTSKRLTVFFCDLQNFSNVAEQLNPKQLTLLLNEYFDEMTTILHRHGATIDKYIGDSIMAFWGAPLEQPDHAARAVHAAFEMNLAIKKLSATFIKKGWPGPTMGIGINTGMMNVGNMGSKYRVAYTVIGDAVNLAARIESLTRQYGVPILVSEATMSECRDIVFRQIDTVQVKGKHNVARIFQPVCLKSELTDEMGKRLALHQKAIDCYQNRDYNEAARIYRALRDADRSDELYPALLKLISVREPSAG